MGNAEQSERYKYMYEAVPGFFSQDDPNTDSATFDYVRKRTHTDTLTHAESDG